MADVEETALGAGVQVGLFERQVLVLDRHQPAGEVDYLAAAPGVFKERLVYLSRLRFSVQGEVLLDVEVVEDGFLGRWLA